MNNKSVYKGIILNPSQVTNSKPDLNPYSKISDPNIQYDPYIGVSFLHTMFRRVRHLFHLNKETFSKVWGGLNPTLFSSTFSRSSDQNQTCLNLQWKYIFISPLSFQDLKEPGLSTALQENFLVVASKLFQGKFLMYIF